MKTLQHFFAVLLLCSALTGQAQLDSIHWLPPMHARVEWGPQYLYLTTPETQPFEVTIRDGAGGLLTTATISNAQPFRYFLGVTDNTQTLVPQSALHMALAGKGLVMEGSKPFFATFRAHADTGRHAGDLTCKGRAALGKVFRIGHLEQAAFGEDRRSNFIGILATEDNTTVSLSDYHAGVRFRVNNAAVSQPSPLNLTLQKGESVVFSNYISPDPNAQPPNGLMGALLETSKPVVVNCGSWLGAPIVFQGHDIGIDQIVPVELTGEEYILCKGNGSDILEHPIIIAHTANTQIRLNGGSVPVTTLGPGDYYVVPTSAFSGAGNLFIQSTQPVYVYQMIGGVPNTDDQYRTAGLMFVPPLSCGIPNAVDNIFEPNSIGSMFFEGGLMLVAMRDSQVTVRINGAVVPIGTPDAVPGNPDFVTYRRLNLFLQSVVVSTISVRAEGAVQVAMYGRNQPASFAAFFSGFTKTDKPTLQLSKTGDGVCPDTLVASGHFDGVQWMLGDSILQFGQDTTYIAYTPGDYVATAYLGVCRRTDSVKDTIGAAFVSPAFEYAFEEPSCFAYDDGEITFGTPYGGIAPYHFSVDEGTSFQQANTFSGISSGAYHLVARDATGCYNHPLELFIGQPDSFGVKIVVVRMPDPLKPGGEVGLEGLPDRPVTAAFWDPATNPDCPNCLVYTFNPLSSEWVTLTVYDTAGCPASDQVFIAVSPNVFVPNVIYPDSEESRNRVFLLQSKDDLPVLRLMIFDRWGEMVFENKNFLTNDFSAGWNGRFHGNPATQGVYVYYAEVELLPGIRTKIKGDFVVLR
ncbi:MAG: gliding motility-associated C-terminal domain-containing protein [Saprospiraceae bacterium]|nr:gliding motility-associated C-terminal domain-containing protein [Saprospiraceae bacterium]